MYITSDKETSNSFQEELETAGFNHPIRWETRRVINGIVEKGHPRALHMPDLSDSDIPAVQAVLDAHVPDFGHVANKVGETKALAGKKIESAAPLWRQVRQLRKVGEGDPVFSTRDAIADASDAIEAEVLLLSDEDAGNYDVQNNPLWP